MLHIVRLIQRHRPEHADRVVTGLVALSASALLLGAGLLLLR